MKTKKLNFAKLRDKLDKIFSIFIRLRVSNEHGMVQCCSCGKYLSWREAHAGHWILRRYLNVRWDENNVNAQCCRCNTFEDGNAAGYASFMLRKHGEEGMNDLLEKKRDNRVWKPMDLLPLIELYTEKAKLQALRIGAIIKL
jgi:hypothetical protein